jgi:aryl-alcohol dehydrogenase (NADP+)
LSGRLTPIDEALEALDTVVRTGKARYIGVSNWPAHRIARALGRSELKNVARIASVQPRYNMLFRSLERDLLPMCAEEGIAVIPYNPLAGGMLTGKRDRKVPTPAGTRFALGTAARRFQERYWNEKEFETVEALRPIAAEVGNSMATVALSWVLANPTITAPIVGASRPEQLAESLAATEKPLPADLKTRLDDLTHGWRTVDADR